MGRPFKCPEMKHSLKSAKVECGVTSTLVQETIFAENLDNQSFAFEDCLANAIISDYLHCQLNR